MGLAPRSFLRLRTIFTFHQLYRHSEHRIQRGGCWRDCHAVGKLLGDCLSKQTSNLSIFPGLASQLLDLLYDKTASRFSPQTADLSTSQSGLPCRANETACWCDGPLSPTHQHAHSTCPNMLVPKKVDICLQTPIIDCPDAGAGILFWRIFRR